MKRFLFTIIFAITAIGSAIGQDFRVRVVNQLQMPISYAVITIEGAPRAVTDIDGVVEIDFRRIRPEYRLAAHAAGYQSIERKVKQEGMTSSGIEFVLPMIEGVVADTDVDRTSDQARALFEAAVGESTAMDFNCTLASTFAFEYMQHKASGELTVENLVDSKELEYFREKGWCHLPIDIRMSEGSSRSVIHKLDESIHYALSELNFAIAAIGHSRHFYKYRPDYSLLGQSADGTKQYYRVSFPMLATKATQIVATVDLTSHQLTSIDILINDRNTSIIKHITAELQYVFPTKKSKVPALCPTALQYTYHTRYADLMLQMSNIAITPSDKKR